MKTTRDTKIAFGLIGAFVFMLALYGVTNLYSHYTGKLETEYVLPYSETQKVSAVGFAVRDENTVVNDKNVSIFYKDDSLVYVPVISDSENIGKNGIIALGFVELLTHFHFFKISGCLPINKV